MTQTTTLLELELRSLEIDSGLRVDADASLCCQAEGAGELQRHVSNTGASPTARLALAQALLQLALSMQKPTWGLFAT